jgi:predicted enzyme related to lactoylglutathione lyase
MDPVVHFEMPYEDGGRMAAFYKAAFGWQAEMLGEKMGNYIVVTTAPRGPDRWPKKPGSINGGLYQKKADWPAQYPSVVIGVKDIRRSMQKVAASGGRVLGEPMDIPGVGAYVSFMDSEGNRVSMLQPLPMPRKAAAKPAKKAKAKRAKKPKKAKKL